jgi:hypothetical protein
MYCARNKLFPGARISRDEDRRIAPRDFRDAREHALQSGGGSDDLLKHRRFVDFFPQGHVFQTEPVFRLLTIFDIRSGDVPTRDLPFFAVQWVVPGQELAIASITLAQPHLQLECCAMRDSASRISGYPLPVIGMNEFGVVAGNRALEFLPPLPKSQSKVFEQNAIGVKPFAVRSEHGNKLRREVQNLPKARLLFADLVFRTLTIGDIGYRSDEFAISGCIGQNVSHGADVLDSFVRQ